MADNNLFHVVTICEELQRIVDAHLKTPLGLKGAYIGLLNALPSPGVTNMVPGIWIVPSPATLNNFDALPRPMIQQYFFRIVYVRLIAEGENIVKKAMDDAELIANTFTDKMMLPDITNLPAHTQILWSLVKSIEWQPPEDDFVVRVHADLTAVAFNLEINVKSRRFA